MAKIEVEIDIAEVFEQIDTDALVDELEDRARNHDSAARASLACYVEAAFEELTELEHQELRRAVEMDDGKRALELLRRAL